MNEFLQKANSGTMYLMAGFVVLVVMGICIFFLIKAYKRGIEIGMDKAKIKKVVVSSATFTLVPSIGLLIGLISLAGALGVPVSWMRFSMIGAIHYLTMAADAVVKAAGQTALSADYMTGGLLASIVFVMSIGMVSGGLFSIFGLKGYQKKVLNKANKKSDPWGGIMSSAMFIGLVVAFVSATFADLRMGSFLSMIVVLVSAGFMALFTWMAKKKPFKWLESFSSSFAMLFGMVSAVVATIAGVK